MPALLASLAQTLFPFDLHVRDLAGAVPLALAIWAMWELRGAQWLALDGAVRRLTVRFGVVVLGLHLLLAAGVVLGGLLSPAGTAASLWRNLSRVASAGIYQAVAGWLLLTAALLGAGGIRGILRTDSDAGELLPWLLQNPAAPPERRPRLWPTVAESAAWLVAALAYSTAWLALARHLVGAAVSPEIARQLEEPGGGMSLPGMVASLGLMVLAPLFEEVAFRGFLLARLRAGLFRLFGGGRIALSPRAARLAVDGAAVVLTAVVWAIAHTDRVEPEWVKWVQIFGLGLALGVLRLRRGLEACVVVHLLFNFPGGLLTSLGR